MRRPFQLVVVGPHGSGKTTVGRLVAARLAWRFDAEIGDMLRQLALACDANAHALRSQEGFDERVFRAELKRDSRALQARVIETWHPGNLAYARLRSTRVAHRYEAELRRAVATAGPTFVQPLRIRRETARRRLREPGPDAARLVEFFLRVGLEAEEIARSMGLSVLHPIWTDAQDPNDCADAVVENLARDAIRVRRSA